MATLTRQTITLDGLQVVWTAADVAGDTFSNLDERSLLRVRHTGTPGTLVDVLVAGTNACSFGEVHDAQVEIDGGEEISLGPFDRPRFNDSQGFVSVSYSDATDIEVAVLVLPDA